MKKNHALGYAGDASPRRLYDHDAACTSRSEPKRHEVVETARWAGSMVTMLFVCLSMSQAFAGYTNYSAGLFTREIQKQEALVQTLAVQTNSARGLVDYQGACQILDELNKQAVLHQFEGEKGCESGKHEALSNISIGKPKLLDSRCLISRESEIYGNLLKARLGVDLEPIGRVVGNAGADGREQGYNEEMTTHIRSIHGNDIFERLRIEAKMESWKPDKISFHLWFPVQFQLLLGMLIAALALKRRRFFQLSRTHSL